MSKATVIGAATEQQIAAWKTKYPSGVWAITTTDDDGNAHVTYVRKPDIQVLGAAAKYAESDPVKSGEIMFNSLRLGGSESVETDAPMLMAAVGKIGELFKLKEADIKKL